MPSALGAHEAQAPGREPGEDVAATDAAAPQAQDIELCANEPLDRFVTGFVTVVPVLLLGLVAWQAWADFLRWHDLVIFAVMYVATGLGITVGFHRHFTHRAFATSPKLRATLAVMGTMAIEGPITASTTPSPTSRATRTARTSTTAVACAAPCAASRTRTSVGCSIIPSAPTSAATHPT